MKTIRGIFRKVFKNYLIYIFILAILLFAIKKPKTIKKTDMILDVCENKKINKDRVALVESGEDAALIRLNLIGNAEKTLEISYYTLTEGESTEIFLASILEAADKGVEVRLLLDGLFHNLRGNLKDTIYGFELHPNINIKFYEPFNLLLPYTWNNRLHDKIIIADENLALIGGRNIGDKYFLEDVYKEDFVKDRDVIIYRDNNLPDSSSVIQDMKIYYDNIWSHEYSKPSIKKITSKQKELGRVFNENLRFKYAKFKEKYFVKTKNINWYEKTMATEEIKFVYNPIGRVNQEPWCLRELVKLSSQAKQSIFIQSPYIIPSRSMISKFDEYDIDLKKVSMLTNSLYSSPNPIAISGYLNNKKKMVDNGVKIYEYQGPESIHGKTYIFDDFKVVIGSFNFDARSSYINSESMVIISSKEFAERLKRTVQKDLDNSLKVDKDYEYIKNENIQEGQVSWFKKTSIAILSKITFFIEYLL